LQHNFTLFVLAAGLLAASSASAAPALTIATLDGNHIQDGAYDPVLYGAGTPSPGVSALDVPAAGPAAAANRTTGRAAGYAYAPSHLPEPAGWSLMLLGLGGMGWAIRVGRQSRLEF
jgi:hypothetical protein